MNAKQELVEKLHFLRHDAKIICADIDLCNDSVWDDEEDDYSRTNFTLKKGHTEEEYNAFIDSLDFEYDGQELFGKVWLTNGYWMERGEYDGSEWWDIHSYPSIPAELQ